MNILVANKLVKKFGNQTAVNELSISVKQGEFYSLLGPNGAGKSTTLNMLSSLLPCQDGEIIIDEKKVGKENKNIKNILGIVPQEISLYEELTALENLHFWGKMYKVPVHQLEKKIESVLQNFGLSDRKNDKIKTYSGGMKRRINIAAALLHDPKIIFMDEPTVGIDPQSRNNIYEALAQLKKEGKTILYTTHNMEEAERFSDRVGIIDSGKIIAEGTVEELKKMAGTKEEIHISTGILSPSQISALQTHYGKHVHIREIDIIIEPENVKKDLMAVLQFCNSLQLEIEAVEIQRANLEKVFLVLTGKTLRD